MALKFNPLKTKTVKNDGRYIFGDFSHGLYLLDTPRTINEQLASLALVGGRNVWAEKGALVPQFGYMPVAQLPDNEIVANITKDSYNSSSFFIVTYSGNVYLYTASQGLKRFKTTFASVDAPIMAHRGTDLVISTEGNTYIFGTYDDTITNVVIDADAVVRDFATYYTFTVPYDSQVYYWNGKKICVDDQYQVNITSVESHPYEGIFNPEHFEFEGTEGVNYVLSSTGIFKPLLPTGNFATDYESTSLSGKSFEINTGVFCFPTTSTRYKYNLLGDGEIQLFNTSVGTRLVVTLHVGDSSQNEIVTICDKTTDRLYEGEHKLKIEYDRTHGTYKVYLETSKNNMELLSTYTPDLTVKDPYYTSVASTTNPYVIKSITNSIENPGANLPLVSINLAGMSITADGTQVWSALGNETEGYTLLRGTFVGDIGDRPTLTGTVSLGEKTIKGVTLSYVGEDSHTWDKTLEPELMAIAGNRLFVADISGGIYYSAIGVIDDFEEANGAGYFQGFYSDSSKTLSIEDYMDGILICKENGIYYLTLTESSINIKKVANIGQESANDHVIVRESVYAYDTNSGSIVNAASVNVFGSIVAGNTVVDAIYLDSQGRGISSSPRWLTYNNLENVMILYYGEDYTRGMVLNLNSNLYPRELDIPVKFFLGFNQGVTGITEDGKIFQDFKNGTIIEGLPAYAEFEAIGLRDNRMICSSILEVTELNGINYKITTSNAGGAIQDIRPIIGLGTENSYYPELIYSDYSKKFINNSFELETRWADKKASLTRLYAPMSGRNGVTIGIEFPKNVTFCLAALRLPDFSQGE